MAKQSGGNGADLGFEARFRAAADKLRGNMEPAIGNAMLTIEARHASPKGVLDHAHPVLNRIMPGDVFFSPSGNPETSINVFRREGADGRLDQHVGVIVNARESHALARTRELLLPGPMSGEIRPADAEEAIEAAA